MSNDTSRYDGMAYRRCGKSGLVLPAISLGLWHNFGSVDPFNNAREMVLRSFDLGINHFDLANNYGPDPGSAEETFGRILERDLAGHRDELIISTKAGWRMWPGPYGDGGSRKYLIASLDQSLKRMGLDYVDIYYHHRPDPEAPLEESMMALEQIVRQGKALYVGISAYDAELTREAASMLKTWRVPLIIHQPVYNMFNRWIEGDLLGALKDTGLGCIVFSPLAQGLLTDKYLHDIPADSRAASPHGFLRSDAITEEKRDKVHRLNAIANQRGQSLAQLAIVWTLRHSGVTSALIGASSVKQIEANVSALGNATISDHELTEIERILG
jgi:L-glyceraldehyde 3-phosphate reductase